jgi:D-arabinose 1-dehydrogenase-like Zn-dependent alcohol dehydrogenase
MKVYQVVENGKPLEKKEIETPVPTGKEILLKTVSCGVCHSDVHIHDGYFDLGGDIKLPLPLAEPLTMGHEIFGEVVAKGDKVTSVDIGERYVAYPWIGCGDCELCNSDKTHYCLNNSNLGINVSGGYGDHVLVPGEQYLFSAGDTPDSLAGSYACRGLTAFSALKKAAPFSKDNDLVIVSAGGLGLLALKIARAAYGINPIVIDIDDEKLKVAKDLGASEIINSSKEGAAEKLLEITNGGANAIVDFVGAEKYVNLGYQSLSKGGTLVVVGLFGGQITIPLPLHTLTEKKILGSYVGSLGEMEELMKLVADGKIEPVEVESRNVSEANKTLEEMKNGELLGLVSLTHD